MALRFFCSYPHKPSDGSKPEKVNIPPLGKLLCSVYVLQREGFAMGQSRDQRERAMRIFALRAVGLAEAGFAHLCSRLLRARLWPSADRFRVLTPDTQAMDRERSPCSLHSVEASRAEVSAVNSRFEQRTLETRNSRACCLSPFFSVDRRWVATSFKVTTETVVLRSFPQSRSPFSRFGQQPLETRNLRLETRSLKLTAWP